MKESSFFYIPLAVTGALALCIVLAFALDREKQSMTESGVVMELPTIIGSFTGKNQEASEGERSILPKDTEIVKKAYLDLSQDVINAQIVLAGVEKRSIHRPEFCLPAQGWTIQKEKVVPIPMKNGQTLNVMQVEITRPIEVRPGEHKNLTSFYVYWFVGDGVTTPYHSTRILLNSWDRVMHHKNHRWAYVAVSAPVLEGFKQDGKNAEETKKMINEFIAELEPSFTKSN
jgi:hypothetical protein